MPEILDDGTALIRTSPQIQQALVDALRARFGVGVTNPANPIRKFGEALGSLPFDSLEQDLADWVTQLDPRSCDLVNLIAHLWPIFEQESALAATGYVHLNYNEIPTTPTPLFAQGDVEFIDGSGARFPLSADLNPPGQIFFSTASGTDSEIIGSGNTRIAQRITLEDQDFPQAVRFRTGASNFTGSPVASIRIETDSAGSPSGTLLDPTLVKTGIALAASTTYDNVITSGALSEDSAYWVVLTVTGGTVTFDGGASGLSNQAKFFNGSVWALSTSVENIYLSVFEGGKAFVIASVPGDAGNIEANAIGSVRFTNPTAQTRFNNIVDSYSNLRAFTGGRDAETAAQLRARARTARSARGTSSPGGIVTGITDGTVPGVTSADIQENDTDLWTSDDVILDNSDKTGAASETVNGTTTRIAQSFTNSSDLSAVSFAFDLATDSSSVFTVSLQTNSGGSPSGTLVNANSTVSGVTAAGTTRVVFLFNDGAFLPPGVYWLVFTRTAGSATFDGSAFVSTSNVKLYNGSWAASANLEDMKVELFGGLPPHSFRLFPEGGTDDAVAQGIYDLRAPGIYSDGPDSGTAHDVAGRALTQHFKRPDSVPVVFSVTVQVTAAFSGDENDLRDLLTEYVDELGVSENLVYEEAKSRLITGDDRTIGVYDITVFRVGRKDDFPTPGDLTSSEVINLPAAFGEVFTVSDAAVDISVTLVSV